MDEIVLVNIYPAREVNTYGISSKQLVEKLNSLGKKSIFFDDLKALTDYLIDTTGNGDLVFVMGAGDIVNIVPELIKKG